MYPVCGRPCWRLAAPYAHAQLGDVPANKSNVSTLAGTAGDPSNIDGAGKKARFYFPAGVAVDAAGTVYVADYGNHIIRVIR